MGLARFGLGVGCVEFWISTRVENSAIFGGPMGGRHAATTQGAVLVPVRASPVPSVVPAGAL